MDEGRAVLPLNFFLSLPPPQLVEKFGSSVAVNGPLVFVPLKYVPSLKKTRLAAEPVVLLMPMLKLCETTVLMRRACALAQELCRGRGSARARLCGSPSP